MPLEQKLQSEESAKAPAYRPVKRARGAVTEDKFRQAAQICFAQRGYAGTKVSDIIETSGCSTGSYYHRFKDKRALFDVMLDEYVEDVGGRVRSWDLSRRTCGNTANLLRHIAQEFTKLMERFGGFLLAVQEIAFVEPGVWARISDLSQELWENVEQHIGDYADEIASSDPAAAMRGAIQTILTVILQASRRLYRLFPESPAEIEALAVHAGLGVLNPPEGNHG